MCWYCENGWPKQVLDIYTEALEKLDGDIMPLDYGPGHCVWADCNFDMAEACLIDFNERDWGLDAEESQIAREALEKLCKVPMSQRYENAEGVIYVKKPR